MNNPYRKPYPKLSKWIIARTIKSLFCHHNDVFERNIHGDEINRTGGHRSSWYCSKCGQYTTKRALQLRESEHYSFDQWFSQFRSESAKRMSVPFQCISSNNPVKETVKKYYNADYIPYEALTAFIENIDEYLKNQKTT